MKPTKQQPGQTLDHTDYYEFWKAQYLFAQQEWSSQLYIHKHGRQLFLTSDDTMGLGPVGINGIQVGDVIAYLQGASKFFALRPLANGGYAFRGTVTLEKCIYGYGVTGAAYNDSQRFLIR
jgi:hypothetical protein